MRGLILTLLLWPALAQAQLVPVQSGNHASFTRLVIEVAEDTDYTVSHTPQSFELRLDEPISGFDISTVFDFIPRDRIRAITGEGAALRLDVTCACHLRAFRYRGAYLVIDVVDGDRPALGSEPPVTGTTIITRQLGPMARPDDLTPRTDSPAATPTPRQTVALPLTPETPAPTLDLPTSFDSPPARDPALIEAEQAIVESLARAATQGLFNIPITALPPEDDGNSRRPPIAAITDPMDGVPITLPGGADPGNPGLVLRTGIDRAEEEADEGAAPQTCPLDRLPDLVQWAGEDGFMAEISRLRRDTTTETGRPEDSALLALAQGYVAYGFGLEAQQVLGVVAQPNAQAQFLDILARIVDLRPVRQGELGRFVDCGPQIPLWQAFAKGNLEATDTAQRSAILSSYRGLPDALRGHLGPQLAVMFAQAGDLNSADAILSGSRNALTGGGIEAERAAASIAGTRSGPEAELAVLDGLVDRDPRATPQDMIRRLDLASETQAPVDADVFDLAATMRFETAETPSATELARAEAQALITLGQSLQAIDLLAEYRAILDPVSHDRLLSEAAQDIAINSSDAVFLNFAFSPLPSPLPDPVLDSIAMRLLDMGFADQALAVTETGADRTASRYLQAEAAAALGDVAATETALAGLSDARAMDIRARAAAAAGDFSGSYSTSQTDSPQDAWRAGAWLDLQTVDDPLLSATSAARLSTPETPGEETPLADRQALLDQSQAARDLADQLLERFPSPTDSEP